MPGRAVHTDPAADHFAAVLDGDQVVVDLNTYLCDRSRLFGVIVEPGRSADGVLSFAEPCRRTATLGPRGVLRKRSDAVASPVVTNRDHGDPGDAPSAPPPLQPPAHSARPSAAEQARTIAASTNAATLATLTADGDPWASFVTYGLIYGRPVLCVSNLAEHGRNLVGDPRASLSIVAAGSAGDLLDSSRITLAGIVSEPSPGQRDAVRSAYVDAVPAGWIFADYSDFTFWVLEVRRVRWVGGYGRMDSATGQEYDAAAPDPVTPGAAGAIAHLNADHADALAAMARAFGGYPDADTAVCTDIDRYGLDLRVGTTRGIAYTRVGFRTRLDSAGQLRSVTAELAREAAAGSS